MAREQKAGAGFDFVTFAQFAAGRSVDIPGKGEWN
jgi:hypothetical protein